MKLKIAVTIDDELIKFMDERCQGNRSEFLNQLLKDKRSEIKKEQTIAALQADLSNPDYLNEIALWDGIVGDGIDA